MDSQLTDAELADRIGSGNERDAEAELFRRLAPRVRLYGLRHLRNPQSADDLAQQVMMTVIESLRAGRLREPDKLASFVLGVCRLTVTGWKRGAQRAARLLERFAKEAAPAEFPAPRLDREKLARCVQALKERERTVIVLSFYHERTGAGLAESLNLSEGNLRLIRHRAIQRLRECMGVTA
jgi:RNA polymerase sigma-70 factor (ECF subfamily)